VGKNIGYFFHTSSFDEESVEWSFFMTCKSIYGIFFIICMVLIQRTTGSSAKGQ
jgi:hypothetical protein